MSPTDPNPTNSISLSASAEEITNIQTERKRGDLVFTCEWHGREITLEVPASWVNKKMSQELEVSTHQISEEMLLKGFEETGLKVIEAFEDLIKEGRLDDIVLDIDLDDTFDVSLGKAPPINAKIDTQKLEETKQKVQKIAKRIFKDENLFKDLNRAGFKEDAARDHIKRLMERREKKAKKPEVQEPGNKDEDKAATFRIKVEKRVRKEAEKWIEEHTDPKQGKDKKHAISPQTVYLYHEHGMVNVAKSKVKKAILKDLTDPKQGRDKDHAISPKTVDFYFQHVVGCSDKKVAAMTSEQFQQVGDQDQWETLARDLRLDSDPQPEQIRIHWSGDDHVSTLINVDLGEGTITIHGYGDDAIPPEMEQLKEFLSEKVAGEKKEWTVEFENYKRAPVGGESAFFVCCGADQLNQGVNPDEVKPGSLDYKNEMLENIAIIPTLKRAMGITE